MDPQSPTGRLGAWNEEESDEVEEEIVTGSVVEFAFGPKDRSYFATSYPYRAEYAEKSDIRIMEGLGLPSSVLEKIAKLKPRYIMNLAIESPELWFMYCYRGHRYTYDSKWNPSKPNRSNGPIGRQLERLKENERDQLSYCAFGPSPKTFFLRATDDEKEWHPRLSQSVSEDLWEAFQDLMRLEQVRAVTFGMNNTWILYGREAFRWSKHGLPKSLVAALMKGREKGWIINKAVLNRNHHREYVLVYDSGPVYYSFHSHFEKQFKSVIKQWSARKAQCPRFSGHKASFPNDNQYDNPEDSGSDVPDDDEDAGGQQIQETRGGKQQHHRHSSSISQAEPQVLSTQLDATNLWASQEPEELHRLKTDSDDFERISHSSHRSPPAPPAPQDGQGEATKSSSKAPVPHQPRSPLPVETQDVGSHIGNAPPYQPRDMHEHKSRSKWVSKFLGGS